MMAATTGVTAPQLKVLHRAHRGEVFYRHANANPGPDAEPNPAVAFTSGPDVRTVTAIVNRLHQGGYVRIRSARPGRQVTVEVTKRGQREIDGT